MNILLKRTSNEGLVVFLTTLYEHLPEKLRKTTKNLSQNIRSATITLILVRIVSAVLILIGYDVML
jgi:hypothetical protein